MTLDDNTRAALHYLTLGVALVLLLVVVDRLLSGFAAPSDPTFRAFQHGYLLGDGVNIVDAGSTRGERIALAVVMAAAGAVLAGVLIALSLRLFGRNARRIPLVIARLVLVVMLAWGAYAAFFVPVHHFFFRDAMIVEWRSTRLVGDLPLPFTRRISLHHGTVKTHFVNDALAPCGARIDLCIADGSDLCMTPLFLTGDRCDEKLNVFPARADSIAAALNRLLRTH